MSAVTLQAEAAPAKEAADNSASVLQATRTLLHSRPQLLECMAGVPSLLAACRFYSFVAEPLFRAFTKVFKGAKPVRSSEHAPPRHPT